MGVKIQPLLPSKSEKSSSFLDWRVDSAEECICRSGVQKPAGEGVKEVTSERGSCSPSRLLLRELLQRQIASIHDQYNSGF